MKTLKGLKIVETVCENPELNVFTATLEDGRKVTMRQPRRKDSGSQRKAWKQVGAESRLSYKRAHVDASLYDMKKRCNLPLYKGETPGVLPLTVEVDGTVIGFCDIFFQPGEYFKRFRVPDDSKCSNGSITALDKYRGIGVGNLYAHLSNFISRHYGCDYILGRTKQKGGMRGIRRIEGWEIVGYDGVWLDHKLRL